MAHVLILRQAVSFVEGENVIQGTHEKVESRINKKKYKFNGGREGYNIPSSSEWKLMDYRIKKECIPDFLNDLGIINLNPPKLDKNFWLSLLLPTKMCKKMGIMRDHWYYGKLQQLLILAFRLVPFLKGAEPSGKADRDKFSENAWCYDFFIGIIEDVDKGFGEEL